eukprot:CAMPEP_0194713224 /NCGR_PEP_ID=MMETSP0296-20130528/5145_1 /TAXON_ID=39354 /ORGANISM="Heterosigma akashiwo, Strain CCMP2393" /LENGTH=149 /DNA_ID=CAMNT_0039611911 /DNA_START=107 /DNA_END=557 /DNA_ORIENTATION=+
MICYYFFQAVWPSAEEKEQRRPFPLINQRRPPRRVVVMTAAAAESQARGAGGSGHPVRGAPRDGQPYGHGAGSFEKPQVRASALAKAAPVLGLANLGVLAHHDGARVLAQMGQREEVRVAQQAAGVVRRRVLLQVALTQGDQAIQSIAI